MPVVARPPAYWWPVSAVVRAKKMRLWLTCSVRYAIGKASYSMRSLPFLLFLSPGYPKMPPYRSVLWTSATMEPMYLAE